MAKPKSRHPAETQKSNWATIRMAAMAITQMATTD